MKNFSKTASDLLFSVVISFGASVALADNLNLLVVMTDDQGRWALQDYDPRIKTPNLAYLASKGVRFDQAIAPTPVCSAARASFLTGKTASQHGVHDFLSDKDSTSKTWLDGELLISEVLSNEGYRVGLFGKWHASTEGWKPVRGYDRWLTYDEREVGWINQYQHSGTVHFSLDGEAITHTGVQARFLSEEAIRFIDEDKDAPFAAFVNFVEPHFPFSGLPERLVEPYRAIASDIVAAGDTSSMFTRSSDPADSTEHIEKLAQYLAAVSLVDEQVGRLMDALTGRGLLEDTLIVFTSDHGHLTGQYGLYGKANATRPQNFYQQSINIPLVVYGPERHVSPGQVRNDFVNLYDLFPTLLEMVGAEDALNRYSGPGKSLVPLLSGQRLLRFRDFQISEMGNARMIHDGRWKLVQYYARAHEEPPEEVWFDLVHPMGERNPVQPPSVAQQAHLRNALTDFFQQYEVEGKSGRFIWDLPKHNAMEPWRGGEN